MEIKATRTTVIKLSFKYSPVSDSNTCIADPNLEALLFAHTVRAWLSFCLLKLLNDVWGNDTMRSAIDLLPDDNK